MFYVFLHAISPLLTFLISERPLRRPKKRLLAAKVVAPRRTLRHRSEPCQHTCFSAKIGARESNPRILRRVSVSTCTLLFRFSATKSLKIAQAKSASSLVQNGRKWRTRRKSLTMIRRPKIRRGPMKRKQLTMSVLLVLQTNMLTMCHVE